MGTQGETLGGSKLSFATTRNLAIIITGGMDGYDGKQGFQLGGIPPHLGGIGRRGGWPLLSSFPSSEFDEELEEFLGGSPPYPL